MARRRRRLEAGGLTLLLSLPLAAGCNTILPPLRGEIDVGRDRYAVFVGGDDHASDLYALDAHGGVFPITYTAVAELAPALSPDGIYVALLRAATLRDSLPGTAWVLDLRTGSERELSLPRDAGAPRRIGWAFRMAGAAHRAAGETNAASRAGTAAIVAEAADTAAPVFVAADSGVYRFDPPIGRVKPRLVGAAERATADSSFAVLLGAPAFARVVACETEAGALCVAGDTGAPELLARDARDPVRWGSDSVAYFSRGALEIRPLGPGRARRVDWANPPPRPRAMTFFPGRPTTPLRTSP
jgi:hypothetical protein